MNINRPSDFKKTAQKFIMPWHIIWVTERAIIVVVSKIIKSIGGSARDKLCKLRMQLTVGEAATLGMNTTLQIIND